MNDFSMNLDEKLVSDAERLYADMGLSLESAIGLFLKQSLIRRALPFEVMAPRRYDAAPRPHDNRRPGADDHRGPRPQGPRGPRDFAPDMREHGDAPKERPDAPKPLKDTTEDNFQEIYSEVLTRP